MTNASSRQSARRLHLWSTPEELRNNAGNQVDLRYTKISAPDNGRVTKKAVEPGDYVQVAHQEAVGQPF